MAKRKMDDTTTDPVQAKKAKVASGADGPTGASIGEQQATDTQGKGKAVADGSDKEGGEHAEIEMTEGEEAANTAGPSTSQAAPTHKIRKLAPPRPYSTVPTSVSATGPRSAHTEGKNYICVTRKTPLGAYLRRCKDVVLKDGYKTLHLNAMGAAIPHLLQLSVSLPSILPHPPEDIHTEVLTGTVEVQDELIPDDEDEDISYRTRGKSTLSVVIKIGDGVDEVLKQTRNRTKGKNANRAAAISRKPSEKQQKGSGKKGRTGQSTTDDGPQRIVIREEDMDDG